MLGVSKSYYIVACVSLILIVVQLVWLKALDMSTSYVKWIEVSRDLKEADPGPDFEFGGFNWEVSSYASADELAVFRDHFREVCGDAKGISAASCVSMNLIGMIPKGSPKREIFDRDYSPQDAFSHHRKGEQGYCTNYAGMASVLLLSVGIPARFVQIRPGDGRGGHNVIEVWDSSEGWVLFDPFNNGLIMKDGKPLSAAQAHFEKSVKRIDAARPGDERGHLTGYFDGDNPLQYSVTYPEPWLYTRIGAPGMPIFRGSFVGFGDGYFRYSLQQNLLRVGSALAAICFCICMTLICYQVIVRRRALSV